MGPVFLQGRARPGRSHGLAVAVRRAASGRPRPALFGEQARMGHRLFRRDGGRRGARARRPAVLGAGSVAHRPVYRVEGDPVLGKRFRAAERLGSAGSRRHVLEYRQLRPFLRCPAPVGVTGRIERGTARLGAGSTRRAGRHHVYPGRGGGIPRRGADPPEFRIEPAVPRRDPARLPDRPFPVPAAHEPGPRVHRGIPHALLRGRDHNLYRVGKASNPGRPDG